MILSESGCDALGFVFYKRSPRYISPEAVVKMSRHISGKVIKVGVFVNEKEGPIRRIAKLCDLDMLQFHGDESPDFCERFKDMKIIKAFRVKNCIDYKKITKYNTFAYLFDTFIQGKAGGTGKQFDWRLLRRIAGLRRPVFLSGGLSAENVLGAIKCAKPNWVDVSTGVESAPGKKDYRKAKEFIKLVKEGKG